jgi:uncharacterized protein YjiS (DUF1127 family)
MQYEWEAAMASEWQVKRLFIAFPPLIHLFVCIGKSIVALVQGIWQNVLARQDLARLADLDDRMLADIGLTRSDLHAAHFAPPWQDPTSILEQRVNRRSASF